MTDIDVSSVKLIGEVQPESRPIETGNYDMDGTPDLMLKFDKTNSVRSILRSGENAPIITEMIVGKIFVGIRTRALTNI